MNVQFQGDSKDYKKWYKSYSFLWHLSDNGTMSSIQYFNHTSYFVQKPMEVNHIKLNFYTPVEDGRYYGITRGGRRPVLCPEHISKTTLARVMKFHGWIDLIQGECSAQES